MSLSPELTAEHGERFITDKVAIYELDRTGERVETDINQSTRLSDLSIKYFTDLLSNTIEISVAKYLKYLRNLLDFLSQDGSEKQN